LFELINSLLEKNPEISKRELKITRYAVVPLSPDVGLLRWVHNTDTITSLIEYYRRNIGTEVAIESIYINKKAPSRHEYDYLTMIQKLEIFEYTLQKTVKHGYDIRNILWLKSRNSEIWLDRRTTFTRSLALMSMV